MAARTENYSATYAEDDQGRLDSFVAGIVGCTRSHARNLILDGNVTINGSAADKAGAVLRKGDRVSISAPPPKELDLSPSDIPIEIVYQDNDIAVVNKPQGMVVHPAPGSYGDTLVNALLNSLDSLSGINGVIRPGIVHRLDKDTSGLLVVAKKRRRAPFSPEADSRKDREKTLSGAARRRRTQRQRRDKELSRQKQKGPQDICGVAYG